MISGKSEMCEFSQIVRFATVCFNVGANNKKHIFLLCF